jgi:DNA processing protein
MRQAMDQADALAALRLARTEGIGALTLRRLYARHGTPRAVITALPAIAARGGRPIELAPIAEAEREMAALARIGGRFLFPGTPCYPPLLALLEDPPPALGVLGDPAALTRRGVALVGARNASAAGRRIAEELAEALAAAGLVVISGLARGIDAAAHLGALRAGPGGRTVAAVAGGLDQPYPPENTSLQARIVAEGGAVVSEAPLGTAPLARHFPRRNRIVAGLALGVVVVEAAARSGSLITARLALEAGRELFAVPGSPLDPRCRGSNDLIRQGAHLTESADDVLLHLPESPREAPLFEPRGALAEQPPAAEADPVVVAVTPAGALLELIGVTPVPVDEITRRSGLTAATVEAMLVELELEGRVALLPGHRVALAGAGL